MGWTVVIRVGRRQSLKERLSVDDRLEGACLQMQGSVDPSAAFQPYIGLFSAVTKRPRVN
jgi:hypothetical protein